MCKCGCNKCETVSTALVLNESKAPATILSEGLKHHIDNNKPLTEHIYRAGSTSYFNLIAEARSLYSRGILDFTNKRDIELLTETDQGYFGVYEGKKVPLDFPMLNEHSDEDYDSLEDSIAQSEFSMDYDQLGSGEKEWVRDEMDNMSMKEAKFKGKTVDLNKPTRGDSKKFKVYVNSGKKNADGSIKVKKVNFGHGGTTAKKAGQKTMSIRKSNPKARSAFRARHNCSSPGPKTMARYWSCKKW